MHDPTHIKTIDLYPTLPLSFIGPELSAGPLPALFYFGLSAHESLCVDPYNQPAVYLSSLPMRIFSIDLPGHGKDSPSQEALTKWAEQFSKGHNVISQIAECVAVAIADLVIKNIIHKERCAAAGLSRGALIAAHVAARCKDVRQILGFAPLTKVSFAKEFEEIQNDPVVRQTDMLNLTSHLLDRKLRFYIGNCDQRVGTRNCFDFIEKLSQEMFEARYRSPSVELIISPSIGFQGHGTGKHIFHQGAHWIAHELGVIHHEH